MSSNCTLLNCINGKLRHVEKYLKNGVLKVSHLEPCPGCSTIGSSDNKFCEVWTENLFVDNNTLHFTDVNSSGEEVTLKAREDGCLITTNVNGVENVICPGGGSGDTYGTPIAVVGPFIPSSDFIPDLTVPDAAATPFTKCIDLGSPNITKGFVTIQSNNNASNRISGRSGLYGFFQTSMEFFVTTTPSEATRLTGFSPEYSPPGFTTDVGYSTVYKTAGDLGFLVGSYNTYASGANNGMLSLNFPGNNRSHYVVSMSLDVTTDPSTTFLKINFQTIDAGTSRTFQGFAYIAVQQLS